MDLPNYSRQLLQQLGALRKEGQFCDCTIVVGSTSHPAHKVALAASSLLFRSLLAGSDSISIDTAVVTPPEFSCLLDMVYTGRLPPGQHNLTRMIAAADSLQMFDVAVGCKNVLTSLMGPSDAALAEAEGQKDATAAEVVGQEACAGSAESVEKSGSGFEAGLELVLLRRDEITDALQDVPTFVRAADTWNQLPVQERQAILACCHGEPPVSFQRLLTRVRDHGDVSPHTLLSLPGLLRRSVPAVIERDAARLDGGSVLSGLLDRARRVAERLSGDARVPALLTRAVEECLEATEREVVLGCCGGEGVAAVLERLVGTVSESGLEKLLHSLEESCTPAEEDGRRAGAEEQSDLHGASLLRAHRGRLAPLDLDPQILRETLQAEASVPQQERESLCALQEEGVSAVMGRLLEEALEKGTIRPLTAWRVVLRAADSDPELGSFIQEVRKEPEGQRLLLTILHVDLLVRHQALILDAVQDVRQLEEAAEGLENVSEGISEFLRSCGGSVHEALQRVLSRDVELALPLCQLLCASLQSVPGLQPLVEDMKRMEEDAPCSAADGESPQHASCRDYSCQWCGKAFRFKCRLATHVKRCGLSAETQRRCTRCGDEFPTPRSLQQHAARAHDCPARKRKKQGPVTCDLCSKTFAHSSGMQYHKRTEHFEEKPYPCTECGAKFAAKSSLKNHARLHTGEKPFRCKHCDMSFSVAAALSYHTKKKHSEGKMYACQYCDAVFAQSIELTRHVRTHTGDKPYVCRQCGKGFSQANGLSVHLQNFHTEPHDCQRCRMSFSSLEEHQSHLRDVHSEEFNQCGDCSKVFSSAVLLEKHRATHAGTKPHHCSLCNKSYQQLSGLWYHNRTTHPEVFASQSAKTLRSLSQCRVCNKAFASDGSLLKHQRAEHADLPQRSCPLCPAAFPTDAGLQQHVVAQHGAVQEHAREEAESGPAPSTNPAHTVVEEERCPGEGAEQQVIALDQSQLGGSQQLFVALGEGQDTPSGSGIVAVSVEDLLDGTVTLICEERR
ncbi:zinc finger and BTB domain-containing protein 40 [Denticeps clupeoides]|nr:zinc finger and BTB domain-containing protein 40 [Denticeps clupeoides]